MVLLKDFFTAKDVNFQIKHFWYFLFRSFGKFLGFRLKLVL